jgi:multiple sugar transport system substrate-binding protein
MVGKLKSIVFVAMVGLIALTGCSQGASPGTSQGGSQGSADSGEKAKAPVISNEPVTLTFFRYGAKLTDEEFQKFFVDGLKQKYPNITLELLNGNIEDLVAAGNTPDILYADTDWYMPLKKLGIPYDMTDLIKKANLDLNQFIPQTVQAIRSLEDNKSMNAIPFSRNAGATFYNKDIFDKFGVAYPKDGMTWNDILELSRKMTREEGGVQYIGWDPGFPDAIMSPYSLPFVDPATNKAVIDNDVYRKIYGLLKQVYDQPGYVGPKDKYAYGPDAFIKDRNLGIITEWVVKIMSPLIDASDQGTPVNWDMATIPNFPENAGKGRHGVTHMLFVSQTSKHKDQAMQVLQGVTSHEGQLLQSKNGRITVLNDQDIINQFGKDIPALQGKNTASIFKFPASPIPKPSLYDKDIQPFFRKNMRDAIVKDNKDINTALREAQAEADQKLKELMSQ